MNTIKHSTTLRKFTNRRIYCAEASRYVTLQEIRERLLSGEKVATRDGIDVTAEVLVMLLVEDTRAGRIPAEALRQVLFTHAPAVQVSYEPTVRQKSG